jgi:putative tryptophan/tyrosine transport system substrate-binding protein
VNRRAFVTGLGAVLATPLGVEAQRTGKVGRIGYLGNANPIASAPTLDAFRQGLRDLGWAEGQNVSIEYRWADGDLERLPALASDLVRTPLDVIHLAGAPAVRAALQATRTIPIVSAITGDPVANGFAASLGRPGGTVTGLAVEFNSLASKQLQLLKDMIPKITRVAFLHATTSPSPNTIKEAEAAARALGFKSRVFNVHDVADFEGAFRTANAEHTGAIYVMPSPLFSRYRDRLAKLALEHRMPAIYESPEYVKGGGLMSYGPNFVDLYRRSASYVDRILKGAKPADLPIEQPSKFELVINQKTAKALGLTIPPSLLLRADQVIE